MNDTHVAQPPEPLRNLQITLARTGADANGNSLLHLTINGRSAYVRDADLGLLEDGIAILRDEEGYWRKTIGEYWLSNVGDDPLVIRGGCRDQRLLSLVRRFAAGESGDLLSPHGPQGGSEQKAEATTLHLAQGSIDLSTDSGAVRISYREHESRDSRLQVNVDGHPFDSDQLIRLAKELRSKNQTLVALRKKAAGMFLTVLSLQGELLQDR